MDKSSRHARLIVALILAVAVAVPATALAAAPGNLAARLFALATSSGAYATDTTARVQVSFVSDGAVLSRQIVRAGDEFTAPQEPAAPEGKVFGHWSLGATDLTPYLERSLSVLDLAQLAAGATPDAANLTAVTAQATFVDAHAIRFHQYTHEECEADPTLAPIYSYTMLTAGGASLDAASRTFVPVIEGANAELAAWDVYGTDPAPTASYQPAATIGTLDADLELYPHLSVGFWVTLDTGEGAPSLESVFVADDGGSSGTLPLASLPTEQSLAGESYNPESGTYAEGYRGWNLGWTLEGWYATRTGSVEEGYEYADKVTGDMLLSSDTTVYAKWTPRDDTPYTIVNMVEGLDGMPLEGRFQTYSMVPATGQSGAVPSASSSASTPSTDYVHRATDAELEQLADRDDLPVSSPTINADGTSYVYVFWPRNTHTYLFNNTSNVRVLTVSGVKGGQPYRTWDPTGILSALTYNTTSVNCRFWISGGNVTWGCRPGNVVSSGCEDPAPEVAGAHGSTVTFNLRQTNNTYTLGLRTLLNDVEYDPSSPYRQTVGGVTYSFTPVNTDTWVSNGRNVNFYISDTTAGSRTVGYTNNGAFRDATGMSPGAHTGNLAGYQESDGIYYVNRYEVRKPFTLTFRNVDNVVVPGGGAVPTSATVLYSDSIASYLPDLTGARRTVGSRQYSFAGWYSNMIASQSPSAPSSDSYRINPASYKMRGSDTEIYAGWEPLPYDVTFDSNGGVMALAAGATLSDDKSMLMYVGVESGERLEKPVTPTKTVGGVDYTFVGWYRDPALTRPWDFASATVQGNTTLYARWVKGRVYDVTYHDEDGTELPGVDGSRYRYGASVDVAPQQGDGGGRSFLGWSLVRGNASYVVGQSFTISSNTDLFAVFGDAMPGAGAGDVEAGAPVLTLVSNYGSLPKGVTAATDPVSLALQAERVNASLTLPSALAGTTGTGTGVTVARVPGYHIAGWSADADGTADFACGSAVALASSTTLYAVWAPNQLSVDQVEGTFTYNGAAQTPAVTAHGIDGSALVAGTDFTLEYAGNTHAGTATVTVRGLGEYAYADPVTREFAIAKARVTLRAADKSFTHGDPAIPGELTYAVASGAVFGADDLHVTLSCPATSTSAVGGYVVGISAPAHDDYEITCEPGTLTIVADTDVPVSAQGWSGTYDGADHTVSVVPTLKEGTTATVRFSTEQLDASNYESGQATPPTRRDAGETTVWWWIHATGSQVADKGGSLRIHVDPAPLTCTAGGKSITYGDAAADAGVTYSGFVAGEDESALDQTGLSFAFTTRDGETYAPGSPAGSYRIVPSGVTAGNYDISYAPGTLTVGRRVVGVDWSAADSMPYTGSARTYAGAAATGLLVGDAVSLDVSGATATHAGSYTATVTGLSGARASSYALPAEGLSHGWRVTVAENSATVAIDDWTYGATAAVPTAIAGFGAETATFEYAPAAGGEFSPGAPATAGTWWVRAVVPATSDYEGATSPAKAFEVARRPVAITGVGAAGRSYDGTTAAEPTGAPALAAVPGQAHSGPVAGDDVSVAAGTAAFDSPAAGERVATFSGFSLSGAAAANYELAGQPAPAAATILPRPLTVTAPSPTVSFGDEPPAYEASFDGLAPGEDHSVLPGDPTPTCSYARGDHAGSYPVKAPALSTNGNYVITLVDGTLTVGRAANSWVAGPSAPSWVLGQPHDAPSAQAAFGTAALEFAPRGTGSWSADVPTEPGDYTMRASVAETGDWSGLEATVDFSVSYDTLAYDANSRLAAGSTAPGLGATGSPVGVAACGFAWEHHAFVGWNTAADGSGEAYAPGDPYELTAGEDVLYAQWDPRGELAYDGNGATSGATPAQLGSAGEAVTVAECGFAREGYDFAGWNAAADGSGRAYRPGERLELSLGGDVLYAQWRERPLPASRRPMYRLYNPNSGEHFYTASADERDAVAAAGWRYEGLGWKAPATSDSPVFRLYNAYAGDHHYTLDAGERDALVAVGWTDEGVGWYSDDARGVPLWRQYNPNALAGAHNFTADEREHLALCALGWRGEGIAWYGVR